MNLHGIVSGAIGTVNPHIEASLQVSAGYTTLPSGRRVPSYDPIDLVKVQVQPLSTSDIEKTEGLNLQGVTRKFWMTGSLDAMVRINQKGGDVIQVPDGTWKGVWLINMVIEQWPEWVSVVATLQNQEP